MLLDVGDDDILDLGLGLHLLHHWVVHAENEHRVGRGVFELMLHLSGRVERTSGYHNPPSLQDAEVADDELGAVGHVEGHTVALLHPQVDEGVSQSIGQIVQFFIG